MRYSTVIISLIILLLAITAGVFAWQQMNPAPIDGDPVPTITPTPTNDGNGTERDGDAEIPEGWQVYQNEELSFKFAYPLGWKIESTEIENGEILFSVFDTKFREQQIEEFNQSGGTDAPFTQLSFRVFDLPNNIEDFIQAHYNTPPDRIIERKSIEFKNGTKALRVIYNDDVYAATEFILIYSDRQVVEFRKWTTSPGPIFDYMEEVFDQIISTFRFLD